MVFTRNAALSAPPVKAQTKSKQKASTRNAAAIPVPSAASHGTSKPSDAGIGAVIPESSHVQATTLPGAQIQHPEDSRLRKRGRNESIAATEPPILSENPGGDYSPNAKRAKGQVSSEETSARGRRKPAPPNQSAHFDSLPQDPELNPAQTNSNEDLSQIADWNVAVDSQYGLRGGGSASLDDPVESFSGGLELRTQSLPVLDNLATQIMNMIAKSSHQEILSIMASPHTSAGQQWSLLLSLFTETRKIYIDGSSFLSAQGLGLSDKTQIDTIKKANLATFCCSLFADRENINFYYLSDWFLDIFSIEGVRVLKPQAELFLDLKTQAYISAAMRDKVAISHRQRDTTDLLKPLFPSTDMNQYFLDRRPGATQLTAPESYFIEQIQMRSVDLVVQSMSEDAIDNLSSTYPWEGFLGALHSYIKTNFDQLMRNTAPTPRRPGRPRQEQNIFRAAYPQAFQTQENVGQGGPQIESLPNSSNDIAEKAARAAHFAMENFGTEAQPDPASQSHTQRLPDDQPSLQQQGQSSFQASGPPIRFHFERPLHPNVPSPPAPFFAQVPYQNGQMQGQWHPRSNGDGQLHQSYEAEGVIPYPTQSAPTHVLYERARQAASTKSSQQQTPRKVLSNTPAQRRPWTPDEENALMAGLDRVKGPHWSQIHAMFGPGGTINDVLKDRNQVQLKDKARNLKLFFLKSNIEVPYYLQFVTGELKTRAPSRVAKNEARQKAMSEEDRAHVQGVMTLAGTANTGEGGLDEEQGEETEQQHMQRLAFSATNDVNIDPALEAQLRQAAAEEISTTTSPGSKYTVPTAAMLMQNIENFIGGSNAADSSKR